MTIYHLEKIPIAKGHAWGIVVTNQDKTQFLRPEMYETEFEARSEIGRLNSGAERVEDRPKNSATGD
jgi:hypothetical protein